MPLKIIKKTFEQLTNQELYQILDLRNIVFIMEQKILYLDTDYYDQKSIHYLLYDKDKLICCLRLIPPGEKFREHALSRITTLPTYRKQGLATKLIKRSMQDIKGKPVRISGQAYLKSYYEKLGFTVVWGPYIEEDLPHYEMLSSNR